MTSVRSITGLALWFLALSASSALGQLPASYVGNVSSPCSS